jgi:polysaccharide pyruvyl transferase WcaK-like protein
VQAHLVPDPAFFLPRPEASRGGGLAIIVRQPVPSESHLAPRLAEAVAGLAGARMAARRRVTILTMERGLDDDYAAGIARAVSAGGPVPEVRTIPIEPGAALRMLAGFDEAVSVRLHGLILCALAGTPCVPITYDPKVAGTAARLGLADLAVPLADVSTDLVADRLKRVATGARRASVEAGVVALRAEATRVAEMVASVVSD